MSLAECKIVIKFKNLTRENTIPITENKNEKF
jgi:hypothetical protein